jgi:transcriptional regulator with XRE-family HTH domain
VTEGLSEMLEKEGVKQTELAERLGKTKGFVSQILAGGRNLTLRTIADVADALGYRVRIVFSKDAKSKRKTAPADITVPHTAMPATTGRWPSAPEWKAQTLPELEEFQLEIGMAA